jgi:uncharacterized protein (TIGR00297 family)
MAPEKHPSSRALPWQSELILFLIVLTVAFSVLVRSFQVWLYEPAVLTQAFTLGVVFALFVWLLRAATAAAALTGALFTISLYIWKWGMGTTLWCLLALFLMTFAATRFGRHRKMRLGTAEGKRGRSASQVAANLGVAVLAGIPHSFSHLFTGVSPGRVALVAMIAAFAEATADTLSSEIGQVIGATSPSSRNAWWRGDPFLITGFRRVPAGTDGAISLVGTLAGCAGAVAIIAVARLTLRFSPKESIIAAGAGIFGLFVDSLLGAAFERRGWLNNDAVNALSTLAAAGCAVLLMRIF